VFSGGDSGCSRAGVKRSDPEARIDAARPVATSGTDTVNTDCLTLLPALSKRGANPETLPIFLTYDTFMGGANDTGLSGNNCCITGYHNINSATPVQTYAAAELDRTVLR
jgi:hypothetical protein